MCCEENHHGQPQTNLAVRNTEWGDTGWCCCVGEDERAMCCGFATDSDGLCDRCRTHCKADQPVQA